MSPLSGGRNDMFSGIALLFIRIYQRHAPTRIRNCCCMKPTCSEYAILAILSNGFLKGAFYSCRRILRCCPSNSGVDLPPNAKDDSLKIL